MKNLIFKSSFHEKLKMLLIAIGLLVTSLTTQMWGWNSWSSKTIYFDNSYWASDGYTPQLLIGRYYTYGSDSRGSSACTMTNISGTNLWYLSSFSYSNYTNEYFISNASTWPNEYGCNYDGCPNTPEARVTYASHYTNSYNTNGNAAYNLFVPASASNNANLSYTSNANYGTLLNSNQKIFQCVAENGGTPAKSTASIGTISISTKYLSAATTASDNSGSISSGQNSVTKSAVRTATVTMTATNITDGYTFLGWYSAETGGTRLESSTTYTYQATGEKTVYARFSHETTHTVNITYVCASPSATVATATSQAIGQVTASSITAPMVEGYTFSSWTLGTGMSNQSASTSVNPISVKTLGSGNYTMQANYTENITSRWHLVGNSSDFPDGWNVNNTTMMQKKTGHSTDKIVYFTVDVTSTDTKEFKVVDDNGEDDDIYYGYSTGGTYLTWTATSTKSVYTGSGNANNLKYTPTVAGPYEFKVDYSGTYPAVTITYPTTYTLTYSIGNVAGNDGNISTSPTTASGSKVLSGNSVTLTAPNTKIGYTWKGWYLAADGSGTQQCSTKAYAITMNAAKTVYACYTENAYNVTVSAGAGGTVSPSGTVSVKQVSGTSITATPNTDFIFKDWTISGGGITPTTSSTSPQTFKATTTGGTITANFTNQWAICGIDDWETWNGLPKKATNVYEGTVTLTAGNHSFKVVDRKNNAWYGKNSTTITRASSSVTGLSTSGNNITITADVPGTYTFNFSTSTKNLTVTYPTAYSVTYDGNGKTSGDVPAVSYHIPASDVTLATNHDGILYKEGYAFNGWNTAPGGGGTHYDAGGTLSSIGADVTLYAEWVRNDYTMYFFNKDSWSSVYAYMCDANNNPEKAWHGRAMTSYQSNVYKIDYRHDVQAHVKFNDNSSTETGNLTIADGQTGDNWFYNPDDASVNTGGIHNGWSQYFMIADYPTTKQVAVVGEKISIEPVVAWADGISFQQISITATRDSGSTAITASVAGTKIIATATAAGTAKYTITYSYLTTTITKVIRFQFAAGITVQSKVPKTDPYWQYYQNVEGIHYWGTSLTPGDVKMTWLKADENYDYYQALVPLGTDNKTNFLFYFDSYSTEAWRKTLDVKNVTSDCCYTITLQNGNKDIIRKAELSGTGLCSDSYQVVITMGSGDIYTSNIVTSSDEIVSFFAPSNANESKTYRRGTVTLEHNGATVATLAANTFASSGVYTAKVKTSTPYGLTDLAPYTGDYYIRTDGAAGGWDNYKTNPANKMTEFTRNTNFPNETFSYYWVKNVAKSPGDPVNIKATVANDINPVLCNFSADDNVTREEHGLNLRFGYEPTTNDLVRGIVGGSTTNNFLNVICADGSQIYKEIDCETLLDEAHYVSNPDDSKFADKSNWVYEIIVYAKIDDTHKTADVVLKSFYKGIHYLLGMVKDAQGHDTSTPVSFPVIKTGTTNGVYGLRVVYDFKTNRLFAAWAPADRVIDGVLDVDADVMFIRHEDGDAAQISFKTNASRIEDIKQAIFALELDNEKVDHGGSGNIERHYFISLPFDCKVSNIFGIGGFMNYWGIQRYNGAKRAQIGWFQETPTFWEWLSPDDVMRAGEGYLLSVDKKALENGGVWKDGIIYQKQEVIINPETSQPYKAQDGSDSIAWVTHDDGSMLTMYFPSTTSGFIIAPATGEALTIIYPDQPCSITREDRDKKDSNWKCIGTPGYKNVAITDYAQESPELVVKAAPRFLYEFHEQTSGATWAKGTYTVTSGSTFTYHSFNSYMVQFAGTINWAQYSQNKPNSVAPRRVLAENEKRTEIQLNLLSEDSTSLDRAFVWLQEEATIGFDQNLDLNKMIESKANQMYSLAENDVPFAANVLPLETDTVKLVVNIAQNGEFIFSLEQDKHVGMAPILYDMFANEQINLLSSDYSVTLEKGKYEDRFFLLFQPEAPIVTNFETTADGGQNVHSSEAIYDVLGRRVNTIYPGHLYIVNGEKRIAK